MERWMGKVAIVTGASSGIGSATAKHLVNAGLKVVGLARRKGKLDEQAEALNGKSGQFHGIRADMTKEEDIVRAFEWTKRNLGPIHVLINNAGILRVSRLIEGCDSNLWREVLDTNVLGLCIATREAVKDMRANEVDGHIVHINSIVGHKIPNIPKMNVYPASKHAVTALAETLRMELNSVGSKIKITSLSPGLVDTDIVDTSISASRVRVTQSKLDQLSKRPALSSEDIANAIDFVLCTPPHVQIHELIIKPVGEFE